MYSNLVHVDSRAAGIPPPACANLWVDIVYSSSNSGDLAWVESTRSLAHWAPNIWFYREQMRKSDAKMSDLVCGPSYSRVVGERYVL